MATIIAEEPVRSGPMAAGESGGAHPDHSQSLMRWLWAAGLVLLTSISYGNSLRAPFLFDDKYYFERDVTYQSVERALASPVSRRLGVLTFALDYRLHRRSLIGCHLLNIAIHATAGLLLFGLVRRTLQGDGIADHLSTRATTLAGIIAAIWLVHPLQTGAVTYVIQRFESLMGMWFLLALYGMARGATARRTWPWYLLALAACWLGVQTKEVMAMLPIVAIVYDRIFISPSWRELVRRRGWLHVGFVACAAWMVYEIRWAFDPNLKGSAGMGTPGVTSWEYLRSQGGVISHYLRLSFWPDYLCLDYRWPIAQKATDIYVPGALVLTLAGLTGYALWRWPKLGFAGMTFFVILAPTSSIMPITDLAFEHRMYLPLSAVIGLSVLGGAYLVRRGEVTGVVACGRRARPIGAFVAAIVIAMLAARTVVRNVDYQDAIRMWTSVTRARPDNSRAYAILGFALLDMGRVKEAEPQFLRAVELKPRAYWSLMGMGRLRFKQEQNEEAAEYFQAARRQQISRAIACEYLARIEERQGNWPGAAEYYREAVSVDPNYESVRLGLAGACDKIGETEEAVSALRAALDRNPQSLEAKKMLARILAKRAH